MTVDDAREWVERIREISDDDEGAHSEEDRLRAAVLEAIRDGWADDPAALARVALSTSEIDFARWCA